MMIFLYFLHHGLVAVMETDEEETKASRLEKAILSQKTKFIQILLLINSNNFHTNTTFCLVITLTKSAEFELRNK